MILVGYTTTEGQTRRIARWVAERLAGAGQSVELLNLEDAEGVDPDRFAAFVLAGSIHAGRYQRALSAFARANAAALSARPSLFLSVSLSAAGDDAEEWQGIDRIAADFAQETGWQPGRTEQVAGAFRFTEYDYFKGWMMRRIAKQKGTEVDPSGDTEFTDWAALEQVIDEWRAGVA